MKRKINILIGAVLILLILPMQFGCNKDKLLQETEEQAIVDANDDMPFPDTDPDGNPISPEDLTNSGNDKSVSINYVKITGDINSWDITLNHEISACGLPAECDYDSYHFYRRKPKGETNFGGWIGYGWKDQHTYNSCNYARHIWNVSVREGDVIETYGFVYGNGFFVGKQGTTYTIADPSGAPSTWHESILSFIIGQIDNLICRGFKTPLATIVNLGFPDLSPPKDVVIISVCDQYGNPLHAKVGHYPFNTNDTFLGCAEFNDGSDPLNTIIVHCTEPDGPEDYDDNLKNRQVIVDCTAYDNEDYWGYGTDHIPVIAVTINTDGTSTVDYPETFTYGGQKYGTVKIGDQIWMAENLNYNCSGSYWYNNSSANGDIYGRLYTWDAAMTAAPPGWHLPTDAEWTTLTNYLGGTSVAGGKMKETGTTHWNSPNTGATNESGFTALPGGSRNNYDGNCYYLGNRVTFWSTKEYNSSYAWSRRLYYGNSYAYVYGTYKARGFSVRLVKD